MLAGRKRHKCRQPVESDHLICNIIGNATFAMFQKQLWRNYVGVKGHVSKRFIVSMQISMEFLGSGGVTTRMTWLVAVRTRGVDGRRQWYIGGQIRLCCGLF